MSRFPLASETIEVRGQQLTIRELTSKQKGEWVKAVEGNHYAAPYMLAAAVCDPPVTPEEAQQWPAQIIEQVCDVARRLSGMLDEKKG